MRVARRCWSSCGRRTNQHHGPASPCRGSTSTPYGGWRGGGGAEAEARVCVSGGEEACSSGSEKCVDWSVDDFHIIKDVPGAAAARRTNHPRSRASPCGGFTSTPWQTARRWRGGGRS